MVKNSVLDGNCSGTHLVFINKKKQCNVILVSIHTSEEKLYIKVKHKRVYQKERMLLISKKQGMRNLFVFAHLFTSVAALMLKETFVRRGKVDDPCEAIDSTINYIEGK